MKRTAITGAVLAVTLASAAPGPTLAGEMTDAQKAIAAIVAIGVGVAIARHSKDHDSGSNWDDDRYGQPFSPSANVVCLPKPRQCYERSHLSARWTRRIFGD